MSNGAEALCEREGEALRRALVVAFADDALAARATTTAFGRAARQWRAVATMPDPMTWVDGAAVRSARRALGAAERRWQAGPDALDRLRPRARVAVVLHVLRRRDLDEAAAALGTDRAEVVDLLRAGYRELGVVDPDLDDDTVPYAG
jgi:DNA-directed RNA polymerase specialized sigma24 family protein